MAIRDVLIELKKLSKDNGLSEPFLVGGLPRDKLLGRSRKVADVDITTGDESIFELAKLAANSLKVVPMKLPDGHFQIYVNKVKFDFSSNFHSPDAMFFLNKAGVSNPTKMQLELFSRDFTCNTLIAPMSLVKISDPTGLGVNDIKNKILKTPLPPRITLRDDPKRVIRAIYLAAKLGFSIEDEVVKWSREHSDNIALVSSGFSRQKLASAARFDIDKTIFYLKEMKLLNVISIPQVIFNNSRGLL